MKDYLDLFLLFARIGGLTFGGGYAMLPILTRELVDNRHWATDEELMDYFAIGQCTPGIIAVNVATFIGNKRRGISGGIVATFGLVAVPLVLITVIAMFLANFTDYTIVRNAFAGVRVCVCVLILNAILRLWKNSIVNRAALALYIVVFLLSVFGDYLPLSPSPTVLVVASAIVGLLYGRPWRKKDAEGGEES